MYRFANVQMSLIGHLHFCLCINAVLYLLCFWTSFYVKNLIAGLGFK